MNYGTPIKKNLWTNKIQNDADIQLFICHLMLDLKVPFLHANSFLDFVTSDNKPVFTQKGAAEYEKLMSKCYGINNGYYEYTVHKLWPELGKWFSEADNSSKKSIQVKNISTGDVMYIAEFMSDFPLISVLYSVNNSDRNKKYKKVGYGTVVALQNIHEDWDSVCGGKPYCIDHIYKLYDNEAKKYFTGILGQENEGIFSLVIGFDDKWQKKVNENSK